MAGGECYILDISGKDSQRSYLVIGLLFLIINIVVYSSFFGLFNGIFDSILVKLLGTLVLGFLVTNIYRINLMSLEPRTLPVIIDGKSFFLTFVVMYITVVLFAFFVSKCFEMIIVGIFENAGVIKYDGASGYMYHLTEMNRNQPWVWLITIGIGVLFVAPVYLRHRLNKAHEYYSFKKKRDIRLVQEDYKKFKEKHSETIEKIYSNYSNFGVTKKYYRPSVQFSDEPFNTKRIVVRREFKTNSDFLKDILGD
jgi:hypothetical protein